ncbi:hypothetical protein Sango_1433600 [Sesamum angolense]|uniref:Uncharacterized protein n=1 Tax=Sesamum angolense TaxID=2727404 RepID=A0AAE1WU98_9LAMI|nr:hypothetical protein Sango_1433600 [Sesamum angolense]
MTHCAQETCQALCPIGERIREECSVGVGMNRSQIILEKKESIESEKQISVDPISLRESTNIHPTMMYPVTTGPKTEVLTVPLHNLLPPAAKGSGRFLSCSLPNSASSSPRLASNVAKHKKKCKNYQERVSELGRQHSVALTNLERLRESHLRRSKSCGEESVCRPSLDFDLWSTTSKMDNQQKNNEIEAGVEEEKVIFHKKGSEEAGSYEDKFKCGACLFLPGFGKGKTVRARKEVEPERDGDTTSSLFFDLPVELIRCSSVNDTESPVTTGFVFDNKDQEHHLHLRRGVLKHSTTSTGSGQPSRKSHESCNSSRHVRFSTSSPTLCPASPTSSCITPRLLKARDDFNVFLEAQSA